MPIAGVRSISNFSRSLPAWPVAQHGVSRRAFSRPCTCQLSPLPQPLSKQLRTDPLLIRPMHFNSPVLPCESDQYCTKTLEELVENTQMALRKSANPASTLTLIDIIQRLGISHRLEEAIDVQLERFSDWNSDEDLFVTALRFRLLRHNGKPANSDVFNKFINKDGKLKEFMSDDTWGMLSLYEASHLAAESEDILLQTMKHTKSRLEQLMPLLTPQSGRKVAQALKLPRHLRMARLEARNYMDEYRKENNFSVDLLQLAKSDFNIIQQLHNAELSEIFRWWKQLGLVDKLSFARDRPLECFLWTVGIFPEPHHSNCRIELTKTIAILLVLDDVFDSFGTLDELILFTNAIKRWDLSAMEQLPEYMKICYMALYNTTNDIAYRVLKEHGWSIVSYLKRTWIDIIEAFLIEAKWFNMGYVPTPEEYVSNGVTTGGTYMALVHAFFLMGQGVTNDTAAKMEPYPHLFSVSGKILRLWDDLGTAEEEQQRGDVASSIQCYMTEKKFSSENEAREHIRKLISSLWIQLNSELMAPNALPLSIIKASLDLGRTAQVVYQHGDDEKVSSVADHIQELFYKPIN